ncbi:MAG: putative heme-binding domain [Segetibacter sp.]|nr:putative heme-binding domain [Segetibacter sp.]
MKKLFVLIVIAGTFFVYSCGGSENKPVVAENDATASQNSEASKENPAYDPERGKGKFTHVDVSDKLDPAMAKTGEKVAGLKCSGCHRMTDEKLVGPGWKGVSERHKPEWIMNFITNTDEMIDKDPKLQAQLELCLVRMPNQSLTDEDARGIYEFMRKNDGVK